MPRAGRPAAHAFSVKTRADLSPREVQALGRPRRRGFPDSPEDVFIICKGRMHMTEAQPPVLVLPHATLASVRGTSPQGMLPRTPFDESERKKLTKSSGLAEAYAPVVSSRIGQDQEDDGWRFRRRAWTLQVVAGAGSSMGSGAGHKERILRTLARQFLELACPIS